MFFHSKIREKIIIQSTKEHQAILDDSKGETMVKVMKTLVMFEEAFDAEKMVPVTSKYSHLIISLTSFK